MAAVSQMRHVFVVGAPRSGTTLMFRLINAHPAFGAIDAETYFFVIRDALNPGVYTHLTPFGGPTQQQVAALLNEARNLTDLYDKVAKLVLKRDGGVYFLEKTPHHVLYLRYLARHYPQAKFINMVRDGRDCFVSHLRLPVSSQYSLGSFAQLWRNSIRSRQQLGDQAQVLDVRYEELTRRPEEVMTEVMLFLDEDMLEEQIHPERLIDKTGFYNKDGHARLHKPIEATTVNQWREKMTNKQVATFDKIAARELLLWGYMRDAN